MVHEIVTAKPADIALLGYPELVTRDEGGDIAPLLIAFWEELNEAKKTGRKPEELRLIFDRNLESCMSMWQAKAQLCLRLKGLTVEDIAERGAFIKADFGDRKIRLFARRGLHGFDIKYKAPGERSTLEYVPAASIMIAKNWMTSIVTNIATAGLVVYRVSFGDERFLYVGRCEYTLGNSKERAVVVKSESIEFTQPIINDVSEFDYYFLD